MSDRAQFGVCLLVSGAATLLVYGVHNVPFTKNSDYIALLLASMEMLCGAILMTHNKEKV